MKHVNTGALDLLNNFSFFCFRGFLFKYSEEVYFFDSIMRKDGYMFVYHLIEKYTEKK